MVDRELMFLMQAKHRLALEMRVPGMRFKGPRTTMSLVNRRYNHKFRRKQQAYDFVCATLETFHEHE